MSAALLAIRDKGLDDLRIRDVATIAGVSSGTVHYYFTDFAGLLTEVYQRASERFFRDRMDVVTEIADARDKLSAMISTGIPWSSDDALVTAWQRACPHGCHRHPSRAVADGVGRPCAAGRFSFNGNGEMTGTAWIDEVGELTLPITISNTHAVGECHTGVIEWINEVHPRLARQWLLPICTETWDGYLNDINGGHVTPEVARQALDSARTGAVAEGSVGGGTGMNCYGFKGGSGTSSRRVAFGDTTYTVGRIRPGELRLARGAHHQRCRCGSTGRHRESDGGHRLDGTRAARARRCGIGDRGDGHRCPTQRGTVRGDGSTSAAGVGQNWHDGQHLQRRPLPYVLHRQRRSAARRVPDRRAVRRRDLHRPTSAVEPYRPVLRRRCVRGRGSGAQCLGRQRDDDRTRRSPISRAGPTTCSNRSCVAKPHQPRQSRPA